MRSPLNVKKEKTCC